MEQGQPHTHAQPERKLRPASQQRVTHAPDVLGRLTFRKPDAEGDRSSMWSAPGGEGGLEMIAKILVVGESNVGKTQLIRRYTDNNFEAKHVPSIGFDFQTKYLRIDDRPLVVQLWDTAGREDKRSRNNSFYHNTHAVVLVFDVTNRAVSYDEVQSFMTYLRPSRQNMHYFQTSAKDNDNVSEAFNEAAGAAEEVAIIMLSSSVSDIESHSLPRARASTWAESRVSNANTASANVHRLSVSNTLPSFYSDLSSEAPLIPDQQTLSAAVLSPRTVPDSAALTAENLKSMSPAAGIANNQLPLTGLDGFLLNVSNTILTDANLKPVTPVEAITASQLPITGLDAFLSHNSNVLLADSSGHVGKPSGVPEDIHDSAVHIANSSGLESPTSPASTAALPNDPTHEDFIPPSYQSGEVPTKKAEMYSEKTKVVGSGYCGCCPLFILKFVCGQQEAELGLQPTYYKQL